MTLLEFSGKLKFDVWTGINGVEKSGHSAETLPKSPAEKLFHLYNQPTILLTNGNYTKIASETP